MKEIEWLPEKNWRENMTNFVTFIGDWNSIENTPPDNSLVLVKNKQGNVLCVATTEKLPAESVEWLKLELK